MTDQEASTRRRVVWIATGYIPVLIVIAGPIYLGLKAALRWLAWRRTDLSFAVDGVADLAAVPLVLIVTWGYLRLVERRAGGLAG